MFIEHLPFRVKRITTTDDLNLVCQLRFEAYGRRLPQFAQSLALPESADFEENNLILLAIEKNTGIPLATMRIQTNQKKPLPIQQATTLPDSMNSVALAEAVRFSTAKCTNLGGGILRLSRNALFKAYYLTCVTLNIEWMVIGARHPIHKIYLRLLFEDISPNNEPVTLSYANNIPHRVLRLHVHDAETLWRKTKHPLYSFLFNTFHPDLELF